MDLPSIYVGSMIILVGETLKDFVSGAIRIVGKKVRDFASRPKRKDRTAIGAMLTDMVTYCIRCYGLENQIKFDEKQPVDFVWKNLRFGFECKHFFKQGSGKDGDDYYVTKEFLEREVVDRFPEQERILGKPIKYRALVVNEKRWDDVLDSWLAWKGIHVCVTGRIDSRVETLIAEKNFMWWFEDMVWDICNGEVTLNG